MTPLTPPDLLRTLITGDPAQLGPSDLPLIRALNLGGYAFARLPLPHPLRGNLRADHMNQALRHGVIRRELRDLLAAWTGAGIPVMPLKGFALAEFEYATPGERYYGDVDLLIPDDAALTARAVRLGQQLGWTTDDHHARPLFWTHETAHLYSPSGHVRLDLHRYPVAWLIGSRAQVQALTRALWTDARVHDWQGLPLHLPAPVDRALIALILNRSWGGDQGGLKPADFTDLHTLVTRHGLTDDQLAHRAAQLGASGTWAAFRSVCHPTREAYGYGLLGTRATLMRGIDADGANTARPTRARMWRDRFLTLPALLPWLPRTLLDVLSAHRAWRTRQDPRAFLEAGPTARYAEPTPITVEHIVGAVRWWTRLLYPRQSRVGVCVPRAYATSRALRRYGFPAVFVSGVARTPGGITGHAWVETPHGSLESYGEPDAGRRFRETFRHPARP
ncbi:lasso peptide biosynthesis B2 protein [Deinococcus enclensis]|uniref:Microcin J25-processing protein McjB C-terminal domain-containing protein n=1 Tax=Deinococcus enclensis TaxID=1049582 RepID=A0ABT9MEN4_9DEIO|nr:lasso peptide biosynthesis B2 protein [Deinococcus enclensis]MDP9765073.1 hypothetical protein [Deinococcus enclensis]